MSKGFVTARLLALGQTLLPVVYLAGAVMPYLVLFTFKGTDHCPPGVGCQAPLDVIHGPVLILTIPAVWITFLGPPVSVLMLLGSFTSLARRRAEMPAGLRRWLMASAILASAFVVFGLTSPGQLILNWVLD